MGAREGTTTKSTEKQSDEHTKQRREWYWWYVAEGVRYWLCQGISGTTSEEWELCWLWRRRRGPTNKERREGELRLREWNELNGGALIKRVHSVQFVHLASLMGICGGTPRGRPWNPCQLLDMNLILRVKISTENFEERSDLIQL